MRKKILECIFIAIVFSLSFIPRTYGQETSDSTSLIGLKGLYVEVFVLGSSPDKAGVSEKAVKRDVERQLSGAGIGILSTEEFDRLGQSLRYPLARFEVNIYVSNTESIDAQVAIVSAVLRQMSHLSRKPVVKYWAPTWESRHVLFHSKPESIREFVSKALEEFISDFRSANP